MGMRLSFGTFISHLLREPEVALSGIFISLPDLIQQMYFYITKLSLTASYIILILFAVRFVLKLTAQNSFYSMWCVLHIKLLVPFVIAATDISWVPYYKLDNMYNSIAPEHTFFYSSEAGFVSIVNSENIISPSISAVTPLYTPAFIWFVGFSIILLYSIISHIDIKYKINSSKENLRYNIYICENIPAPFVMGIFRPKIYIPTGLTEQEQEYVITHEKSHIKQWDHILKLIAYFATCLHWFNPLVWLAFVYFEKDMEMSCDERVMDKLGYEHKQDYSRCILSLSTGRRFAPKAQLCFGDSDVKKRIKNILGYKKATLWVSVFAAVILSVSFTGILTNGKIVSPPSTHANAHEINMFVKDYATVEHLYDVAIKYNINAEDIEKLYNNMSWNYGITSDGNVDRIKTVLRMFIDGYKESEIVAFVKEELIANGLTEENYKTLTHLSLHPIAIYCMEETKREIFVQDVFNDFKESNQPGGSNRILMYEELANSVFLNYRDGLTRHDSVFAKAPEDFVYPEMIHWGEIKFVQDETGYFNVSIPSADGRYNMIISIGDFTFNPETPFESTPTINNVSFYAI